MTAGKRLIEVDFPLEQTSLDSVHEKNVRHGHISTLHIWPARRPLAASRAALIAMLLPDPGDPDTRKAIYRRLAGEGVEKIERKKVAGKVVEKRKRELWAASCIGGASPGPISSGFGKKSGRLAMDALRVYSTVRGWWCYSPGGDAARLRGHGDRHQPGRLVHPEMHARVPPEARRPAPALARDDPVVQADLAWHVRAWGRWVLAEARKRLTSRYPTYAELQPLKPGGRAFTLQPLRLLKPESDEIVDVAPLNASFDAIYLNDPRNPLRFLDRGTGAPRWQII